jgi:hypothetical protein
MRKRQSLQEEEREAKLLRAWQAWHNDARKTILAGQHRDMFERLLYILEGLRLDSAPLLLAYVRGVDWPAIDTATRQAILHEISSGIIKLRIASGCEPFDDDPFAECPSVFHIIKEEILPA